MTRPEVPALVAETREVDPGDDLLAHADPREPLVWLRRGDGFVGAGAPVARLRATGADAARDLATAWRAVIDTAVVRDDVDLPGTGLLAFGAGAFAADSPAGSTLVVPSTIVGRRGGRAWRTRIRPADGTFAADPSPIPFGPHWAASFGPGALGPAQYQDAVRTAVARIRDGVVRKVVLARDLVGTGPADADLRRLARTLATGYPDTWTYAVDGILGASPETLVTVHRGAVSARVLAGTVARGVDEDADAAAVHALATSTKDLDEHGYAVRSVLAALSGQTSALAAAEPFTLRLPNVWHLATDVEGELSGDASALDLVAALHPTAAVAGTPTDAALALIGDLEPADRGRYAGPVGWIDHRGDGEWAIALRGVQVARDSDGLRITAHAGAGIVAASDAESELVETRAKFRPIVDALLV